MSSSRPPQAPTPRRGGLFTFKLHRIVQPRVRTRESLPEPPKGMAWEQEEHSLQWKLVPATENKKATEVETSSAQASQAAAAAAASVAVAVAVAAEEIGKKKVVDSLPSAEEKADDEWEMLSERVSSEEASGTSVVMVNEASVRSIGSSWLDAGSHRAKLGRTHSNSTIDSVDYQEATTLLVDDYVEHIVLPSDTLQGICLAYKISSTRLRQANKGFSGHSLLSAPKKLVIPLSKQALRAGYLHMQDTDTQEYKIHALLCELPFLKQHEALGYLESSDWIVPDAVQRAKQDHNQEITERDDTASDICITVQLQQGVPVNIRAKGAGLSEKVFDGVPAIATKSVRPQDVYNAAPQHEGYGVELKSIGGDVDTP